MKTNFYHVKFIYEFNNKKYIFSVDNIEAISVYEAQIQAGNFINNNTKAEIITILKRKNKSEKCKTI